MVRRAIVDWARSAKGRRRLFGSIRKLARFDQEVFDRFYWQRLSAGEIVEGTRNRGRPCTLADVFASLERIERALSSRQRADLIATAARLRAPESLDEPDGPLDMATADADPEQRLGVLETERRLKEALSRLPAEDRLIAIMRFVDGLSHAQIARALHARVTEERVRGIIGRLRAFLEQTPTEAGT